MSDVASNESLTVTMLDDGTLVAVGDLDMAGGPILELALAARRQDVRPLAIDISGVDFIDSSGLRTLLAASREAADRDTTVTLRNPTPAVSRLLEVTGTFGLFEVAS